MRRDLFPLAVASLIAIPMILFQQSALAASLNAQAGLWKITTTAGGLRVPVMRCVTWDGLPDPASAAQAFGHPFNPMSSRLPEPGYHTLAEQIKQTCKFRELNQASDSLTYTYECTGSFRSTEQGIGKIRDHDSLLWQLHLCRR